MTDENHSAPPWLDHPALRRVRIAGDVVARPLRADDAASVLAILDADPGIRDRVGVARRCMNSVDEIAGLAQEGVPDRDTLRYVLDERGRVVGYVNLWRAGSSFAPDVTDPDDIGFGYFLDPAARGRGLVVAALRAMMDAVLAAGADVCHFVAFCEDDNPASFRTLQRAGFVRTERGFVSQSGWRERRYEIPVRPIGPAQD